MSNETYIGHRYVPQVEGEWSNNKAYEELSIVLYEGNSYTSKQKVPEGVDIKNETFWALSGNYNAQMEQLRQDTTAQLAQKVNKNGTFPISQLSKNSGLIDQSFLSPTLIGQIAGNAPVLSDVAYQSVSPDETNFIKNIRLNIFNKDTVTEGIVHSGFGTISPNVNYNASDFIPINPNKILYTTISQDGAWYDKDKKFIDANRIVGNGTVKTLTPPANAAFLRMTFHKNYLNCMVSEQPIDTSYYSYGEYKIESTDEEFSNLIKRAVPLNNIEADIQSYLKTSGKLWGKKWAVVGDSLTEKNATTNKNYHDFISEKTGCTILNYGYSGTGYIVDYATSSYPAIKDRINEIDTTSDLITVFAGTNDFGRSPLPLGTFGDTDQTATLYGAIYYVIDSLIKKFPTKTIAVFTPIPRISSYGSLSQKGLGGYTLEQLAEAMIKVCKHFSVPCLDLFHNSNLPVWNQEANAHYFTAPNEIEPDGLHPNDAGHKVLADKILAFINTL